MRFDPTLLLVIPGVIASFIAQMMVSRAYGTYSKIGNARGITGAQAASHILSEAGLNIPVEPIAGELTDHYDPSIKVLRLSEGVYDSSSIAAVGIAAHEAGHALQDANNYAPMRVRGSLVPFASIGGNFGITLAFIGLLMGQSYLINIGIILFSAVVAFQLITLPVEFDASKRALKLLDTGILQPEEVAGARKVLSAAALTYLAAALTSILTLVRLILLRDRRR